MRENYAMKPIDTCCATLLSCLTITLLNPIPALLGEGGFRHIGNKLFYHSYSLLIKKHNLIPYLKNDDVTTKALTSSCQ